MTEHDVLIAIPMEEACLTLEQLAVACAVEPDWVLRHIREGFFPAPSGPAAEWRFTSAALQRARRIREIERDFEAVPELAALVADLLDQMDELKARLARAGFE
jgi:chaperone modulatory protein CbpM